MIDAVNDQPRGAQRAADDIDGGEPRNAPAPHMHGFLSRDGLAPAALLELGRAEIVRYGVRLIQGRVDRIDHGYYVRLAGGPVLKARRVLVATGLRDELPRIPGVRERWGKDLLYCPYCHAYEVRDRPLAVLGTHPGSLHQALPLRAWSDDVVFFPHTVELTAQDRERLEARGLRIIEGEIKHLVIDGDRLQGIELTDGRHIPRAAAFLVPRMVPHDELLTRLGCGKDDAGRVTVGRTGRTGIAGVWAAGNVIDPPAWAPPPPSPSTPTCWTKTSTAPSNSAAPRPGVMADERRHHPAGGHRDQTRPLAAPPAPSESSSAASAWRCSPVARRARCPAASPDGGIRLRRSRIPPVFGPLIRISPESVASSPHRAR